MLKKIIEFIKSLFKSNKKKKNNDDIYPMW